MARLLTGPIVNTPVLGIRPTQTIVVKIVNSSLSIASILIEGYAIDSGTVSMYVSEMFTVTPLAVVTRQYFGNHDGFEFVFTSGIFGADGVTVSVWGNRDAGPLEAVHRIVLTEQLVR